MTIAIQNLSKQYFSGVVYILLCYTWYAVLYNIEGSLLLCIYVIKQVFQLLDTSDKRTLSDSLQTWGSPCTMCMCVLCTDSSTTVHFYLELLNVFSPDVLTILFCKGNPRQDYCLAHESAFWPALGFVCTIKRIATVTIFISCWSQKAGSMILYQNGHLAVRHPSHYAAPTQRTGGQKCCFHVSRVR